MELNAVRSARTIGISASTSSANGTLPTAEYQNGILVATNPTLSVAYLVISETASPTAAFPTSTANSGIPVPAGSSIAININPTKQLYAGVILASGSGTIYLTVGQQY